LRYESPKLEKCPESPYKILICSGFVGTGERRTLRQPLLGYEAVLGNTYKVFTVKVCPGVHPTSKNFIFIHPARFLMVVKRDFPIKKAQKVFTRERFLNGL
jgi:hypothetical protein